MAIAIANRNGNRVDPQGHTSGKSNKNIKHGCVCSSAIIPYKKHCFYWPTKLLLLLLPSRVLIFNLVKLASFLGSEFDFDS